MSRVLDFSHEADPAAVGMTTDGIRSLAAVFESMVAEGLHPAAQMVVAKDGKVVFDRAIGTSRGKPITPETPFLTFSCGKSLVGFCIHKLIEEGKIELDAPVAEYWPEFGVKGKATATIRHTLLHQAGIPARRLNAQVPLWPFWPLITRAVANLEAEFLPGTKTAYHLVNYGFILGEVLRRVTGIPIDKYLHREFTQPLGMTRSWLRIPINEIKNSPRVISGSPDQDRVAGASNLTVIRHALNPAAGLHSTARELAVYYQMLLNGGEYGGKRYLKTETIHNATQPGYRGWDSLLAREVRMGLGVFLGGAPNNDPMPGPVMGSGATLRTFGHFGNRSCMAWADPDAKLVVTFTCNRLLSYIDTRARWTRLSNAVWEAFA